MVGIRHLKYNFSCITDLSSTPLKNRYWDFALTIQGDTGDSFVLAQEQLKLNTRDKHKEHHALNVLTFGATIIVFQKKNPPRLFTVVDDERLKDSEAEFEIPKDILKGFRVLDADVLVARSSITVVRQKKMCRLELKTQAIRAEIVNDGLISIIPSSSYSRGLFAWQLTS
jgi:hypothetical protein